MKNKDIAILVKKAQKNEKDAFEELYLEIWDTVYYYCYKQLGNDHDAKDALQTVFMQIYKKINELHHPNVFNKYLCTVMTYTCLNYKKEIYLSNTEDIEDHQTLPEDHTEFLPQEAFDKAEIRQEVAAMIEKLPYHQREAILLFYYEEMSLKEISEITNSNSGAVNTRLVKARKSLKKYAQELLKKGALGYPMAIVPVPILTRILQEEMPKIARPEIGEAIWQNISTALGIGAAGSAAAAVVAAAKGSVATATTAVTTSATVFTNIIIAATITVTVAGSTYLGVQIKDQISPPSPPPIVQELEDEKTETPEEITEQDLLPLIKNLNTKIEVHDFIDTYEFQGLGISRFTGADKYTLYYLDQKEKRIYLAVKEHTDGDFEIAYEITDLNTDFIKSEDIPGWFSQNKK